MDKATGATTYTGCLEEGTTPGTYVLSNVSESGKSSASQMGQAASGQASQAGQSAAAKTEGQRFTLSGTAPGFDFKDNLNHRVQITGSIASAAANPSAHAGEPNEARPNAGMSASATTMQSITVTTAKSLSDRCSVQ